MLILYWAIFTLQVKKYFMTLLGNCRGTVLRARALKGIVSRDFMVCFLVSFDRSDISTHQERGVLFLKVRFRIEFFDFRVRA
jgi:hypothetical protein